LGNYIAAVAATQDYTLTDDPTAEGMEGLWRWHVHSFFNCNQRTEYPQTADFTEAGKPDAWGTAYQEVYGKAVVLPEIITETFVLPTPVKEGCTFEGWYWEADFSGAPVKQLEVGDSGILYAKWAIKDNTTTGLDKFINTSQYTIKVLIDGRITIWRGTTGYDLMGNRIQ
jgi:uncharacterized repeat protein (TIGR02543 family)